ncbi:MAG: hypothetical protein PHF21_03280 [Bacilli bacterium]|nr:hypothetical protein [Bacilli bacterium]
MGYDTSLDKFYKSIVVNKLLLNKLKDLGWYFEGNIDGRYVFSKF